MYTLLIFIYVYEVKMCKLMLCCKQGNLHHFSPKIHSVLFIHVSYWLFKNVFVFFCFFLNLEVGLSHFN